MPDLEPGSSNGAPSSKSSKADKKKQTILVIAAIVGVLLTYLLYRRSQANAAAAATAPASTLAPGTDTTGTATPDITSLLTSLGSSLGQLTSSESADAANIAALQAAGTPVQPPPPTGTTPSGSRSNIVPGAFNQKIGLRAFAASLLTPAQAANPDTVQSELLKLIDANPSLAHAQYVMGGHTFTPLSPAIQGETAQQASANIHKRSSG